MATTRMVFNLVANDQASAAFDKLARNVELSNAAIAKHNAGVTGSSKALDDNSRSVDRNNSSMTRLSGTLTTTSHGFGALVTSAVAFAPAIVAASAVATAGIIGLGGIVASTGAALGVFGLTAKAQFDGLSKGYQNIQTLKEQAAKAPAGSKQQAADYAKLAQAQKEYAATFGPAAVGMNHLQDAWNNWKKATSGPTLSILAQGMNLLAQALPQLRPLFDTGAQAAQRFLTAIQSWVDRGGLKTAVDFLNNMARSVMPPLEAAMRNLAQVAAVAAPWFAVFANYVATGFQRITAALAAWATGGGGAQAFSSFIQFVITNGPRVWNLLTTIAAAAVNIARALAPLAPVTLAIATGLAQLIASAPPWVIQAAAVAFVAYSLAMKGLLIITPIITAVKGLTAAMFGLDIAMSANAIGVIILALAALAAAIAYAWTHCTTFRVIVETAFNDVKNVVMGVVNWFAGPFATFFGSTLPGIFTRAWAQISAGVMGPVNAIINAFQAIKNWVTSNFDAWWAQNGAAIEAIWRAVWGAITQIVQAAWAIISPIVQVGWAAITTIFRTGVTVIQTLWNLGWNTIETSARMAWVIIQTVFSQAWATITAAWQIAWNILTNVARIAWAAIQTLLKIGWDIIIGVFTTAINLLTGRWGAAWNSIRNMVTQVWNAINSFIGTALSAMRNMISNSLNTVIGWFQGLGGRILSALGNLGSLLVQSGQNLINGLFNGIKGVWNDVVGWFAGLPSKILSALGIHSPPDWAIDAGTHIMNGVLQGLAGGGDVKSFFMGIVNDVTGPLKSVWSTIQSIGGAIGSFISNLVGGGGGGGVGRWSGVVSQALSMLGMSQSYASRILYQMQTESGGDPNAINLWDSNAARGDPSRGLMQVIGSTFAAYHVPGTSNNIYDPLANVAAAINYARHVYGSTLGLLGSGHGYARGSWDVPVTGPAVIHQGEMILPAELATTIRGAIGSGSQPDRIERLLTQLIHVSAAQGEQFARALDGTARRARVY